MSVKEAVLENVAELPDDASADLIKKRVDFILGVQKAIESAKASRLHSVEAVRSMVPRWAQAVPDWEGVTIAWDDRDSLFEDPDYRDHVDA